MGLRRSKRQSLLLVVVVLLFAAHTLAPSDSSSESPPRTLSVCPSATDASAPFSRTLHEALAKLRRRHAEPQAASPVTLELCAGRHPVPTALELVASDTVVEIRGPADGLAVLDSGVRVSSWLPPRVKNGPWHAPLPAAAGPSRQLWINGVRAVRAHANPTNCSGGPAYANVPQPPFSAGGACDGSFRAGTHTANGYAAVPDQFLHHQHGSTNVSMLSWLTPGSELVFGRGGSGASWTEPRCAVTNVTPGAKPGTVDIGVSQPCWARATTKHAPEQDVTFPSDIENALALLDEPGEWYGDFGAATRTIYYLPRPAEQMSSDSTLAVLGGLPSGGRGSALVVQPGAALKKISNIGFEYQTWLEPSSPGGFVDLNFGFFFIGPNASASVPKLNGIPGALWLRAQTDVVVSNCSFMHLGLSGIVAGDSSQGIVIARSLFQDLSGSAILLGNLSDPTVHHSAGAGERIDTNFTVSDATIRETAVEYSGAAAIFAGVVSHTTIEYTDIDHTSNGGIVLGYFDDTGAVMKANTIRHNKITHSEAVLYDTGSIYTLGAQPGSAIYGNLIIDQVLLFGSMYHDQSSSGFTTVKNVIVGGKMWLYLQWGTSGPVSDIVVAENFHNQAVAGGCGSAEHAPTCHENVTVSANTLVNTTTHDDAKNWNDTGVWPAAAQAIARAAGVRPVRTAGTDSFIGRIFNAAELADHSALPVKTIVHPEEAQAAVRMGSSPIPTTAGQRRTDWPPRPIVGSVSLTQATFANRDISAAAGDNVGAALRVAAGATLRAFRVVFQNLSASHGGAAYVGDGGVAATTYFVNCSFLDNRATAEWGGGGAVAVYPGAAAAFAGCLFARNHAYSGGAVWSNGAVRAFRCTFTANIAASNGGGLIAADGSAAALNITESNFADNHAAAGTGNDDGSSACFVYSDMERWDPNLHQWFPGTCDAPGIGCDGSDWVDPRAGLRPTRNCCYKNAPSLTIRRGNPDETH